MTNRYSDGRQDAWIEATRENCERQTKDIKDRLDGLTKAVVHLTGKVNHIYGAAMILAAIAAVVVDVLVRILAALILKS